jgi:nucleotide-binding universal stress UspA family protein
MFPQIKKILFATDLSENSRRAFRYAVTMADRHGAGMVILHVLEPIPGGAKQAIEMVLGEETSLKLREANEMRVKNVLIGKRREDDLIRNALADFYGESGATGAPFDTYEFLVKEGNVADQVIDAANKHACDLIVIGAHKGLLSHTAVGASAKNIVRQSRVPVLVVPPPERTT